VKSAAYYESERAAAEYLLLHYGDPTPWRNPFPTRCVTECLGKKHLPKHARALDLGCAVGGASFELARCCAEVIAIDASRQFIETAQRLQKRGNLRFNLRVEGDLTQACQVAVPKGIDRTRVSFEVGDATRLRADLGMFDVIFIANLIDRVADPRKLLAQLSGLIMPGGQLILTSPYTWLEEYTPRANWLGGFKQHGRNIETFSALKKILSCDFTLSRRRNIPFLIREHSRKFQLCIAEATVWDRHQLK
jgi:putative 4-mercaptohistidine N1-methyltranferase